MDTKTRDAVLEKILEIANNPLGRVIINFDQLEQYFNIPPNLAKAEIASLREQGLIEARFMKSGVMIYVQPIAHGYQFKKEENKKEEFKKKWRDFKWDLAKIIISSVLTLCATIITQRFILPKKDLIPVNQYNKVVYENKVLTEKVRQLKSIDILNIKAEINRLEKKREALRNELNSRRSALNSVVVSAGKPVTEFKTDVYCKDLENDITKIDNIIAEFYKSFSLSSDKIIQ